MSQNQPIDSAVNATVNQQLLFRVWAVKAGKFLRPVGTYSGIGGTRFIPDEADRRVLTNGFVGINQYIENHNLGLGDYYVNRSTSIVDRNRKPIYEGDIVQWTQRGNEPADDYQYPAQLVTWCHRHNGWRMFTRAMLAGEFGGNSFIAHETVVVGNVFENSELLK